VGSVRVVSGQVRFGWVRLGLGYVRLGYVRLGLGLDWVRLG